MDVRICLSIRTSTSTFIPIPRPFFTESEGPGSEQIFKEEKITHYWYEIFSQHDHS